MPPPTRFTISLPPELARIVTDAVESGLWASADEFIAHAIELTRTTAVLGGPLPAADPPPAAKPPTGTDPRKTPGSGGVPAVDLTRQSFDSSSFMGELTRRLHGDKK